MKYAICIVLPSNKRVTMETNFQNPKNDHFQILKSIYSKGVYERYIVPK